MVSTSFHFLPVIVPMSYIIGHIVYLCQLNIPLVDVYGIKIVLLYNITMKTFAKDVEVQQQIKRSVFIGIGCTAFDEASAKECIRMVKSRYADATHVAWAYIVGSVEGYSDAGEPAGTAGPPIYRVLKGASITHGVICVVRYYGGIKLGKRGLIDAYGHTAQLVVEKAGVVDVKPGYIVEITHGYDVKIDGILRSLGIDVRRLSPRYEDVVRWWLKIDEDLYNKLINRLGHISSVNVTILRNALVEVKR